MFRHNNFMTNKTIRIRFEGDDVVIDIIAKGSEETKSEATPAVEVTANGNEPVRPKVKTKTTRKAKKGKASKPEVKTTGSGKRKKISQEVIDQINMLRDDQGMTSKQIADELGISLPTVNKYYQVK